MAPDLATTTTRSTLENPVPSITLSITKDDGDRIVEASKAVQECFLRLQKRNASSTTNDAGPSSNKATEGGQTSRNTTPLRTVSASDTSASSTDVVGKSPDHKGGGNRPLHETIFESVKSCEHPLVGTFLEKMKEAGATQKEIRSGAILLHDADFSTKVKLQFDVLGTGLNDSSCSNNKNKENYENSISREGATSLFRSIIIAVSSCIHKDTRVQVKTESDTDLAERPKKRMKEAPNDVISGLNSIPTLQSPSPSFDSASLAKDEEEKETSSPVVEARKEFEEIATYATDHLFEFVSKANPKQLVNALSFDSFDEWHRAEGFKVVPWLELMDLSKWQTHPRSTSAPLSRPFQSGSSSIREPVKKKVEHTRRDPPSPTFYSSHETSRTVVSFDFTGSMPEAKASENDSLCCINISEENLWTLRNLVHATGLERRPSSDICGTILGVATRREINGEQHQIVGINGFHECIDKLIIAGSSRQLSKQEVDIFTSSFIDFFSCFDNKSYLKPGEADAKELAVGFCFLCAGNKSSKLASGFELMQGGRSYGLSTEQLAQYLRSYLTMLVGISLLTSSPNGVMKPKLSPSRRNDMLAAVENGSRWTLGHFLKTTGKSSSRNYRDRHTFEAFATWYTTGGYNVAPWLELLDLKKLLSLVGETEIRPRSPPMPREQFPLYSTRKPPTPKYHSPRQSRHAPADPYMPPSHPPPTEVLFTFPLANRRSLVVLREDATYVRGVVEQLGLLSLSPDEVWSSVYSVALKRPALPPYRGNKPHSKVPPTGKSMPVNKSGFVECMQATIQSAASSKKRYSSGNYKASSGAREILENFFHSFDLHQIDRVALNELMGGLTLLCGGKKSTKLAFAFGVFDHRPQPKQKKGKKPSAMVNSLGGEDLFLFLRSFLIVMFSCCRQSWDLSDDAVGRYIADTANMVTEDVMRYQWSNRKRDRVDFDEFGEWYNEGGFETAPWLELLDLKKWVLVDSFDSFDKQPPPSPEAAQGPLSERNDFSSTCPPPPPEDSVDPSFFADDGDAIMPMDSMDEMDIILMQQPSQDKENDVLSLNKIARSFSYSPRQSRPQPRNVNSLKFHLVTEDDHGGYMVSVSQKRILHLRHILMESGLYRTDGETACKQILGKSFSSGRSSRQALLGKDDFDSAMRGIIASSGMSVETQRTLSDVLGNIFTAFDRNRSGTVNAAEVACGFTVLCHGKKSDKLEHAFEILDREKRGHLSRSDTARYLRSFLTVLLNIASTTALDSDPSEDTMTTMSGSRCDRSTKALARAVEAGSSWAASQAFKSRRNNYDVICFDEFAEWYTHVGYSNIPWLELLDLHKWVVTEA